MLRIFSKKQREIEDLQDTIRIKDIFTEADMGTIRRLAAERNALRVELRWYKKRSAAWKQTAKDYRWDAAVWEAATHVAVKTLCLIRKDLRRELALAVRWANHFAHAAARAQARIQELDAEVTRLRKELVTLGPILDENINLANMVADLQEELVGRDGRDSKCRRKHEKAAA